MVLHDSNPLPGGWSQGMRLRRLSSQLKWHDTASVGVKLAGDVSTSM